VSDKRYEVGDDGRLWELHSTMKISMQSLTPRFGVHLLNRVIRAEQEIERLLKMLEERI
jgi:hypothetical protein